MKKCLALVLISFTAYLSSAFVEVLSPNGGEILQRGIDFDITWTGTNTDTKKIELYKNGVFHSTIIYSTENDGIYRWRVPFNVYGDNFKIKISSFAVPFLNDDYSDNYFSIDAGTVEVLYPNGGESVNKGDIITLRWLQDFGEMVGIDLYQNGLYKMTISENFKSERFVYWTVPPGLSGSDFTLKVYSTQYNEISDFSDSTFTITDTNSITIISPNGRELFARGETVNITWTDVLNENVKIELYKNGAFYKTISSSTLSNGSFSWMTPTDAFASDFKIKVTSTANEGYYDFSDENFSIGQIFTEESFNFPGFEVVYSASWCDYDNDGDMDIYLNGSNYLGNGIHERFSKLFKNDNLVFMETDGITCDLFRGSSAWGDYDNDGYIDILITGMDSQGIVRSEIYRNNGNGYFSTINAGLTGFYYNSVAWGDYDNDGDLDIIISGSSVTKIYRNDSGVFTDINAGLPGFSGSSIAWKDLDNDGDLDILLTGESGYNETSRLYINENGKFININAVLPNISSGSTDCGDYDNDGDLDILLTGDEGSDDGVSYVLKNDNGYYNDINAGLSGVLNSSSQWGDYDNDGDLDIILSGSNGGYYDYERITKLYSNDSGLFSEVYTGLAGKSKVAWGDYDNDSDLDILIAGYDGTVNFTRIYSNNCVASNTTPNAPGNLRETISGYEINLSWDKVNGNETPQNGLSYNIRMGTSPGTGNVIDPMSNISDGFRKVIDIGNAGLLNSRILRNLASGAYYWAVQAIDHSFSGSVFSVERTFIYASPAATDPAAQQATGISFYEFTANWDDTGDKGYYIELARNSQFTDLVEGYENVAVITGSNYTFKGLQHNTTYFYRVRSYNGDGIFSNYSNVIEAKTLFAQFTDINAGLLTVQGSRSLWGDYDNDGDLDVLLTGIIYVNYDPVRLSIIYRNDDGLFSDINAGIEGIEGGSAAWGDYDNDGDLDIVIAGNAAAGNISLVYRNDDGNFTDINAKITGVRDCDVKWSDVDNDGDLDLILSGNMNIDPYSGEYAAVTKIFININCKFVEMSTDLPGMCYSSIAIGDYDNDNDNDLLISGLNGLSRITRLFRNDNSYFTEINAGLKDKYGGSNQWGDYDCDGDLDILITGYDSTGDEITKIYRNDSGIFTDINAPLQSVGSSSTVDWGDYDNDGDLDILLTGYELLKGYITKVYRNDLGIFTEIDAALPNIDGGSAEWGDYDNDGDLDILLTGYNSKERFSRIYRNNSFISNNKPDQPTNLSETVNGNRIEFLWDKSNDNETPQNGLTYNIYLGSTPHNGEYLDPMSDITSGFRKIPIEGNSGETNSYYIRNLSTGTYFWGVQAVDNAYTGSTFSEESSFEYSSPLPTVPEAYDATEIDNYSFVANWEDTGDKGYLLELAYDSLFTDLVVGYECINVLNRSFYRLTELKPGLNYYYRVQSYNADSIYSAFSNSIQAISIFTQYTEIENGIIGAGGSTVEWGDYDNDGDLDLLITGTNLDGYYFVQNTKIYRNDNSVFTDINANLPGIDFGTAKWGDYDNDGDLDILLIGYHYYPGKYKKAWAKISTIYRNDNGVFTDIEAGFQGVDSSSGDWGDFDNDGDLDVALIGWVDSSSNIAKVYRNDNGSFTDISANLKGIHDGSVNWIDYDNDCDLDLFITGDSGTSAYEPKTLMYNNDNNIFKYVDLGIQVIQFSSSSWCDYDSDGDSDVLITGYNGSDIISCIYRNNEGSFTDINAGIQGVWDGSAEWGDYDNDGDSDIIISGSTGEEIVTLLYRNDKDSIININTEFTGVWKSASAWGDYDNDGDLDILHSGYYYDDDYNFITKIYRNNSLQSNFKPKAPSALTTTILSDGIEFNWFQGTDSETPQDGLSYNLCIGSESGKCDIVSPMSDIKSGYRKVADKGNVCQSTSWKISGIPDGTYYWSVQAIDNCFAGSDFASEQTFTVTGIEDENLPVITALYQNYPNPFNPMTVIKYSLTKESQVNLTIFDIKGRIVDVVVNKKQESGWHEIKYNADRFSSGIYYCQLKVDNKVVASRKMMMLK